MVRKKIRELSHKCENICCPETSAEKQIPRTDGLFTINQAKPLLGNCKRGFGKG